MGAAVKVGLAAAVALTLGCCCVGAVAGIALSSDCGSSSWASDDAITRWSQEQIGNATTIVTVGARLTVPQYGWVVAVATAMQESGLRNLGNLGNRNDHDSLGLFQQRPSQGWGTPSQLMDPNYAATKFYEKLLRVAGWQQMPLTQAAQAVQVSAFPDRYAKWEADARALVNRIAGHLGVAGGCEPGAWVSPLQPGSYTLTSPFGPRWDAFHYGQDFAAPTGTPIRAASAGTVVAAGCTSPFCDRPGLLDAAGDPTTPGCGLRVIVSHALGVASMYCHASALAVHEGQSVAAGQVIAWVGSTGQSTGPHLHFQIHLHTPPVESSTATDPVAFLASVGVEV
jgi:murein DD-endopeptidase MepM/ murein hydrolase activator NlpD